MRRARAKAGSAWGRPWNVWLPAEDRRLAELAPLLERTQVAEELSREFGVPRTPGAVRRRARILGVALRGPELALADVERLFGVDGGTVLRRWVGDGALRALPRDERMGGNHAAVRWRFRETDLEAFVRAHPWRYDWTRLAPGHRLRSLAEVVHRADPWLTLEDASTRTGLSVKRLRTLVAREDLPHERRWHGCGPWGTIVVRAADLDALLA